MNINFSKIINKNDTVAVALSGGSDSMALLYYMLENKDLFSFNLIAINVEHGIRGDSSVSDSLFVSEQCKKLNVPLISYKVDCLAKCKSCKLSVEQSARILRYECFFDAIKNGKCNKIATAHHKKDNAEAILLNLFRGTGLKGMAGINETFKYKIIRPFLDTDKKEIENYIKEKNIPYVTDETNFCDDYKRNFIRLNILPEIEKIFPDAQNSIVRFSKIAKLEDEYLDNIATNCVTIKKDNVSIKLPQHKAIFNRAVIIALKSLGIKKDWEKVQIDEAGILIDRPNGAKADIGQNICAIKEYDKIVFFIKNKPENQIIPFKIGKFSFSGKTYLIEEAKTFNNIKDGLYADINKIPEDAVIRAREKGDKFTKFGGGTKSLGDYLTDKKVPLRLRDSIPLLCHNNNVLVIFGYALSDSIKVDNKTEKIIKFI